MIDQPPFNAQSDPQEPPYQPGAQSQLPVQAPPRPSRWVLAVAVIGLIVGAAGIALGVSAHTDLSRETSQVQLLRSQVAKDAGQSEVAKQQSQVSVLQSALSRTNENLAKLGGAAKTAHLGVCVDYNFQGTDSDNDTYTYEDVEAPTDQGGVPSCPNGSFISVVPGG